MSPYRIVAGLFAIASLFLMVYGDAPIWGYGIWVMVWTRPVGELDE